MELPRNLQNAVKGPFKDYTPPSWDDFYMKLVYEVAKKSKDPSTKIGAYIVGPDHEPISFGFNGMPRKVHEDLQVNSDRYQRPKKYLYFEHGERNAIYSAARIGGASLKGTTMYTQSMPCADCARAVIQAGITDLVLHQPHELLFAYLNPSWKESCNDGMDMVLESGIRVRYTQNELGVSGYISGQLIEV